LIEDKIEQNFQKEYFDTIKG